MPAQATLALWHNEECLKGCPLSSPLFLLSTRPILRLLQETVLGCLCVRAFADDIAAVFDDVTRIASLHGSFTAWEEATGLALNLKKTKIVPLNADPRHTQPDYEKRVREAIQYLPPPWSTMKVASTVRYLGVGVGPRSKATVWNVAMTNWVDRANKIAAAQVPPTAGLRAYTLRALPCIGYVAQIVSPPSGMANIEQTLFSGILRFPYCSCPRAVLHRGGKNNTVRVPPAAELCQAIMLRCMARHLDQIEVLAAHLQHVRDEMLPMDLIGDPLTPEPGWDQPAYVSQMLQRWQEAHGTVREVLRAPPAPHLQKRLLDAMILTKYPSTMLQVLSKRIAGVLRERHDPGTLPPLHDVEVMLQNTLRYVSKRSPVFFWLLCRGWCKAWATAHRLQRGRRGCVWCCSPVCVDNQAHVEVCLVISLEIARAWSLPIMSSPLGRMALAPPDQQHLIPNIIQFVAAMTFAYHRAHHNEATSCSEGRRMAREAARASARHLRHLR